MCEGWAELDARETAERCKRTVTFGRKGEDGSESGKDMTRERWDRGTRQGKREREDKWHALEGNGDGL